MLAKNELRPSIVGETTDDDNGMDRAFIYNDGEAQ